MLDLGAMFCKRMDERTTIVDLERRLAESETRYRLLIESWAQAVWETDADGVVVVDSPSWRAYTGQTVDEWLGYGWLDAIHPDDRAYAERQWRQAIEGHRLVDAEFRLRSSSGGWRWTNVRAAPVLDAGGAIEKWAGINIDIDARKRAELARSPRYGSDASTGPLDDPAASQDRFNSSQRTQEIDGLRAVIRLQSHIYGCIHSN